MGFCNLVENQHILSWTELFIECRFRWKLQLMRKKLTNTWSTFCRDVTVSCLVFANCLSNWLYQIVDFCYQLGDDKVSKNYVFRFNTNLYVEVCYASLSYKSHWQNNKNKQKNILESLQINVVVIFRNCYTSCLHMLSTVA